MRNISLRWATLVVSAAVISMAVGCTADPKPPESAGPAEKKASAGPGEKKAPAVGDKTMSDEAQVRGHWICVECTFNGQPQAAPETIHALFTDKELKLSYPSTAAVYEYHFHPQSRPKHCDLSTKFSFPVPAIYSLEGGKFRLCKPTVVRHDTPYPASFAPGKECVVYTFKRLEKETRTDEASLSPQQREALAGQRKEMAENIERLEGKKYSEFMEHSFPPEARNAIKQRKNGTEEMLKLMEERGPLFAQLLRALSNEVPAFNADASRATLRFAGNPSQRPPRGFSHYLREDRRSLVHGRSEPRAQGK